MQNFPREDYLARLGLPSAPAATERGLQELHRAQACAVPFENVEPFLGRTVALGLADFHDKILLRNRGGYCFELNRFFGMALENFGFKATRSLGRVFMGRPNAGARTHYVNLVEISGRTWLADVGFGGPGLVNPIPFEAGFEGEQQGRKLRLRADSNWGIALEDELEGKWRTLFALPEEKVVDPDVLSGNHFCATHPDSTFRQNLFCAKPNAEGRVTVWNRELHVQTGSGREQTIMSNVDDLTLMFRERLMITVSAEDVAAIHAKLPPHAEKA